MVKGTVRLEEQHCRATRTTPLNLRPFTAYPEATGIHPTTPLRPRHTNIVDTKLTRTAAVSVYHLHTTSTERRTLHRYQSTPPRTTTIVTSSTADPRHLHDPRPKEMPFTIQTRHPHRDTEARRRQHVLTGLLLKVRG